VTTDDLEARLWAIESHLAISQLPSRYAMAADARDIDALVNLFAPDIRDEWREWVVPVLRSFRRSIHQIVGHRFDLDPDDPTRASGTTYCRAEHEFQDRWIVVLFRYHDEYRCADGEWTFGALRGKDYWYAVDITERPQSVDFTPGTRSQKTTQLTTRRGTDRRSLTPLRPGRRSGRSTDQPPRSDPFRRTGARCLARSASETLRPDPSHREARGRGPTQRPTAHELWSPRRCTFQGHHRRRGAGS
jgi:hypothetical protein